MTFWLFTITFVARVSQNTTWEADGQTLARRMTMCHTQLRTLGRLLAQQLHS